MEPEPKKQSAIEFVKHKLSLNPEASYADIKAMAIYISFGCVDRALSPNDYAIESHIVQLNAEGREPGESSREVKAVLIERTGII